MGEQSNLHLFVRVVEEGSFSAAARSMGNTPSSVSRQVSQLENELGARLFHRTTRKQSLTEAGEIYYQHANRIIADLEEARLSVSRLTDAPSGNLHVTVDEDFAVMFVAPILPEFLERYPDVQLRLSLSSGKMDLIEGGIDVAIRMGHLADSSLIARKIATSRSVICAAPDYLKKHGTPKHPSELERHNCLSYRISPGKNIWRFEAPEGGIDVGISGRVNVNSVVFLRNLALAGSGIVMSPTWMVGDALKKGELVQLLKKFPLVPASTPIHAVFAHNRHLAPKVRAFVQFMVERLNKI